MLSSQPAPGDSSDARLRDLHRQLGIARARLRAERQAFESRRDDDLAGLAAARNDAEAAEREAVEERQRLRLLRRRLSKRWAERWSAERQSIAAEEARLTQERKLVEGEGRAFEERQARRAVESATEKAAIQKGWEDLNAEEQDWRARWTATEAAYRERERELGDYAGHVVSVEQSWQERAASLQNACAQRAEELAGLERRIAALRLQLSPIPPMAHHTDAAEVPDGEPTALQQHGLRLFRAREEWRGLQIELFGEMEELSGELRGREEAIARREVELRQAERDVRHERKSLAATEARAKGRELLGLAETDSLKAEVRHLHRVRKGYRTEATRIRELWLERATDGEEFLRYERGRSIAMLEQWTAAQQACQAECARQRDAAIALDQKALAIAKARLELLPFPADSAVAAKRVELHERRLRRAFERARNEREVRRRELVGYLGELRECAERVEANSVALLRNTAAAMRELAAREEGVELAEASQAEAASRREFLDEQRIRQERTIGKLQAEIERLSRLVYDEEAVGQNRAA